MNARRGLASALALSALAAGVVLGGSTPAAAGTGFLSCETTSHDPRTNLNTWECDLNDTNPSGEVWRGPQLHAGSNGTTVATGQCRTVTLQYAYYIEVSYTNDGVATSVTSTPFLCGNAL